MTVYNGTWEYSGGNGMQVVMDITWSAVTHTSTSVTATYKIYTDNQYTYADTQTLAWSVKNGGTTLDSGSVSFNNDDGSSQVLRRTETYTYTYPSGSYGTSPATLGFAASISGAYNGVTPSVSAAVAVPARPAAVPDAPVLTATVISSSQINLSWTTPDNNGSALDAYVLQVSTTSSTAGFANLFSDSTLPLSTTYSHTGLTKYTNYWYRVLASNGVGNSAYSTVRNARTSATVPGAPTGLTATSDVSSVTLNWTAPADTGGIGLDLANDYIVKRGATVLGYTGSATTFTDTGLTPATSYTYTVEAVNSIGSSTTASVTITTVGGVVNIATDTSGNYAKVLPQVWNGAWVPAQARIYDGVGATEDNKWKYGI